MKNNPLFKYSLNFKVFSFSGVFLASLIVLSGIALHLNIDSISLGWWIFSILCIFIFLLFLFLQYITFPLERISKEILALLTGKVYQHIPPERNDEIGVITHFFNKVSEKVQGLSEEIDTGKRMKSELELAARIQKDVFPKNTPDNIIGLDIVAKSKASSEIGGDCFDFLNSDDDTLIYIGDATGHGVAAGLVMMLVSTTIKALANESIEAKEILNKSNQLLRDKISTNHFLTLAMLRWQNYSQKMSFIGAGHEYILHYSLKDKKAHAIKTGGIALKMIPDISKILKEVEINFQEGDSLLLYTDGITEARNKDSEMYGLERLKVVFEQNAYRKASDIFDRVSAEFSNFVGANHKQEDDITMIVIKNIGQHSQSQKIQFSVNNENSNSVTNNAAWSWE